MALDGSRYQDECFTIAGKSANFYQIILENTIRQGKLEIPSKFVKNYGDDLSSPIVLKIPTGESWEVELLKKGDKMWLEKGWQEFSDYHNLKHGHLLIFQFEGESHFHVCIFDMSAVEIEYRQNESEEDEISCQILDDSTSDNGLEVEDPYCSIQESQGKLKDSMDDKSKSCGDLEDANNLIPKYPSFKIIFNNQTSANVPFGFVRQHMKCESQRVMLQIGHKSWAVRLSVYSDISIARFSRSWSKFVEENSLQPRDVCSFELIKRNVLLVSIFRYEG